LVYKLGVIGAGIRVLLFSWIGSVLCIYIGRRVFKDFNSFKVALEAVIIPAFISSLIFFISNTFIQNINISEWFEIVLWYSILSISVVLTQILVNLIVYKKFGLGTLFLREIKNQLLKISRVVNDETP
jgi:hypothetical protein